MQKTLSPPSFSNEGQNHCNPISPGHTFVISLADLNAFRIPLKNKPWALLLCNELFDCAVPLEQSLKNVLQLLRF